MNKSEKVIKAIDTIEESEDSSYKYKGPNDPVKIHIGNIVKNSDGIYKGYNVHKTGGKAIMFSHKSKTKVRNYLESIHDNIVSDRVKDGYSPHPTGGF